MRVLLSSYTCRPGWSSEPGLGWGVASSLAELHDVWVLTESDCRETIEDPTNGGAPPRLRVVYVDTPKVPESAGIYGAYLAWQTAAYRSAKRLHAQVGFDLVQHVTFANSSLPSWMGRLGIPFFWYAGSFAATKPPFLLGMGARSSLNEMVRNLVVNTAGRVSRNLTLTPGSVTLSLHPPPHRSSSGQWRKLLMARLQPWEADALGTVPVHRPEEGEPFRVLSVGRMLGWKGFHLGLRAFARFRQRVPYSEYWLIGEGSQRSYLERLARSLGLGDGVRFTGALSRRDALAAMGSCDVLLHPSLHEHFGFVILEAMASGRPVVCLDAAGPPELVGDTGLTVEVTDPQRVVACLATALTELHDDPDRRLQLGAAARRRAAGHWSWRRIARELDGIYREIALGPMPSARTG